MKDHIVAFMLRHGKVTALLAVAIPLLILIPFLRDFSAEDILAFTPSSPLLAAGVIFLVYIVKCIIFLIPLQALYIVTGMLFSTPWALLLTFVSLGAEFTISYFLGKNIALGALEEHLKKGKSTSGLMGFFERNHEMAIFVSRMLPIPVELLSMFYGATGVPYGRYILLSLLGSTPTMIPFVLSGHAIEDPLSMEFLLPFAISLLISGIVMLVFQRVTRDHEGGREAKT